MSPIELTFYLTQPMREWFRENLHYRDYIHFLMASRTLYRSAAPRKSTRLTPGLHLSPLFFEHCACNLTVSQSELRRHLYMIYENVTSDGLSLILKAPRPQQFPKTIYIAIHAQASCTIKLYDRGYLTCTNQYKTVRSLDESEQECFERTIELIFRVLVENGAFNDESRLEYFSENLRLYAFVERMKRYCNDIHRQYLKHENIRESQVFGAYMQKYHLAVDGNEK